MTSKTSIAGAKVFEVVGIAGRFDDAIGIDESKANALWSFERLSQ